MTRPILPITHQPAGRVGCVSIGMPDAGWVPVPFLLAGFTMYGLFIAGNILSLEKRLADEFNS